MPCGCKFVSEFPFPFETLISSTQILNNHKPVGYIRFFKRHLYSILIGSQPHLPRVGVYKHRPVSCNQTTTFEPANLFQKFLLQRLRLFRIIRALTNNLEDTAANANVHKGRSQIPDCLLPICYCPVLAGNLRGIRYKPANPEPTLD